MGRMRAEAALHGEAPIRVLIVDDSEDDAYLLRTELARRGLVVDCRRVDSALDMAAALAGQDWDLILSDHDMPGFDALAALDVLKRSGQDIPFIIHSGQIADRDAVSAMYDGVDDYICKGDYERLVPVIEREMRGLRARRAVRHADTRIQQLAYFDGLSALPNHHLFCNKVGDAIREHRERGRVPAGAVLVVDLDRFLRINASFGYEAGNDLLRQVGQRLRAGLGPEVVLARLGGDEFGVFLPGVNDRGSVEMLARWIVKSFDEPLLKDRVELFLTASVGIAMIPSDGEAVLDLLMNAETALGQVKRAGGNDLRFYERTMNAASAERLAMEADLRHAVERGELLIEYQPVISARHLRPVGAEALVRWLHPRLGRLPPDRFIPLADETGLIAELGAWVLCEAARQARAWLDAGHERVRVSVNVSAVQFSQPRLLEVVADALRRSALPPACLVLEITETSLMADVESAAGMLRALKNMGVQVAVDDFGTGYSSLSYLKRLPIDIIKIDKSFVRELCENDDDAAIVRAIIALAGSLRLATIAEGVESAGQAEVLRLAGCDFLQGFHFSRPTPAAQLVL
ncbi:putative bifunctional diguanylate cyclase/phosphodiesterase [Pseudothauera rhizosphaerae]|uniref:EAL domain-containing protein n=1 Tax=Pseudothauera rhizosphaerae TaxID=2565932 RepID=A0A4S4AP00_9RHOO|nr:EAL domain-containing response regulator [Pseudothauera rhizosphaerae]THF60964.1 EAL domain-containing protein [Pseudothauera rhizosphaerae]